MGQGYVYLSCGLRYYLLRLREYSPTAPGNFDRDARRIAAQRNELADQPNGYRQRTLKEFVRAHCDRKGVCVYRALDSRLLNQLAPIKVDDELWDLERPLEKSVKLELLDFEHPEGVYLSCVQIVSGH